MAIDYAKFVEDLKDSVVTPVTEAATAFLKNNKDAALFLEDRAKRVAELGGDYIKATDDAGREAVILQLQVVRQSVQNELSKVAVGASIESRATFGRVLDAAVGVLIKAIPIIVAAI